MCYEFFSGSTICPGREAAIDVAKDVGQVEREGPLHVKFTVLDGKVKIHVDTYRSIMTI